MKIDKMTRRQTLAGISTLAAAASVAAQQNPGPKLMGEAPGRIAPMADLVNVLEFENVAERKVSPAVYATIAGGDRTFFDRITLRPRMMVDTTALDLSVQLFGEKMFSPVLAGPMAGQQAFHAEGELATARGASAAKTSMVVSSDSSQSIDKIAAAAKNSFWYQVYPDADVNSLKGKIQQGIKAGCKAVCITVGAPYRNLTGAPSAARLASMKPISLNWDVIDQLRQGVNVPVLLKGIMTADEADAAVKKGIQGIIVSNQGGMQTKGLVTPIEMLPAIAGVVAGRVPVLIDGGFRRGSDIFKALALGATAVLLGRPAMWGLAAYGADGVQAVLEMLQTDLGRTMGQCGNPNIKSIGRTAVKIHEA